MGIVNTIIRSRDDFGKPEDKSYWGTELVIELVPVEEVLNKKNATPSEKRLLAHELSGKEPIEQLIFLSNKKKELGDLTTLQVKEILDDMGFNVDVIMSDTHFCDFAAVMNINGFLVPGWETFMKILGRLWPKAEKMLLAKLSPGKERLHIRMYEMNDGKWAIGAHTDWNWMSINLFRVYRAHMTEGAGDYETGTMMMHELLKTFVKYVERNEPFTYEEIARITRWTYYQSLANKLKWAGKKKK